MFMWSKVIMLKLPVRLLLGAGEITVSNEHTSTRITEGSATVAHITISAHQHAFPIDHHIRYAHDTIVERMTATVHLVELGPGRVTVQFEGACGRRRHWAAAAAAAVPAAVAAVGCCCGCGCCCAVETCRTRFSVGSFLLSSQFCLSLSFHLSLGSFRPSFRRAPFRPPVWLLANFCAVLWRCACVVRCRHRSTMRIATMSCACSTRGSPRSRALNSHLLHRTLTLHGDEMTHGCHFWCR